MSDTAGMNEHMSKPVDMDALKQTLGRYRKKERIEEDNETDT